MRPLSSEHMNIHLLDIKSLNKPQPCSVGGQDLQSKSFHSLGVRPLQKLILSLRKFAKEKALSSVPCEDQHI